MEYTQMFALGIGLLTGYLAGFLSVWWARQPRT